MGSRFASLNLPEHLRTWHSLGLRHLYSPDREEVSFDAVQPEPQPVQRPVQGRRPAPAPRPQAAAPTQAPERPAQRPAHPAAPGPDAPASAPRPVPNLAARPPQVFKGELPAPWDSYLARMHRPCKMVWTYWELCQDFAGQSHAGRGDIWRRLIGKLGWPKGTSAFWPLSEIHEGRAVARREHFWRGVEESGAKHIVCFGRRAAMTLFPERGFRVEKFPYFGRTVHILPDTDALVQGDREAMYAVWNTLSAIPVDKI